MNGALYSHPAFTPARCSTGRGVKSRDRPVSAARCCVACKARKHGLITHRTYVAASKRTHAASAQANADARGSARSKQEHTATAEAWVESRDGPLAQPRGGGHGAATWHASGQRAASHASAPSRPNRCAGLLSAPSIRANYATPARLPHQGRASAGRARVVGIVGRCMRGARRAHLQQRAENDGQPPRTRVCARALGRERASHLPRGAESGRARAAAARWSRCGFVLRGRRARAHFHSGRRLQANCGVAGPSARARCRGAACTPPERRWNGHKVASGGCWWAGRSLWASRGDPSRARGRNLIKEMRRGELLRAVYARSWGPPALCSR